MYQPIAEHEQVRDGETYRTTYFLSGPYPPALIRDNASRFLMGAVNWQGRIKVTSHEWFPREFAQNLPNAPYNAWALRIQWKKLGPGTPLLFFTGPAGILTLRILALLIGIAGIVVILRTTERLIKELIDEPGGWILVAAAVGITWMVTTRRG